MKKAYFAGGCFWCIAAAFEGADGVNSVTSGYSGGDEVSPAYADVKRQKTGHRESICIDYDESVISYAGLLDIFFDNVDPFDGEGQFIDKGFSYTLALFYRDISEKTLCEDRLNDIECRYGKRPAVSVLPFKAFYPAEEEHQNYAKKHPEEFDEELKASGRSDYFKNRR